MKFLSTLKKGQSVNLEDLIVKEGKTSPPKRFTTGSIIIAMENAGKLIEDEELREHIKGSGIGTSATRSGILTKLEKIGYIKSNNKTQVVMPALLGEIIYDVVKNSIPTLLNPELTASWEKGLTMVTQNEIAGNLYMDKLENYIIKNTDRVLKLNNGLRLKNNFDAVSSFYKNPQHWSGIIFIILNKRIIYLVEFISAKYMILLFFYFIINSNNFLAAFLGPYFSCPSIPKEVLICPTFTPLLKNSSKY